MNFKQLIQDYFTFSRNERKGITILLVVIFLLAVANKLVFYFEAPGRIDAVLFDSARLELGYLNDSMNRQPVAGKLFAFDPNTIDSSALENLDLPVQIRQNILKFRIKGGRFYSQTDFRKIYGMNDEIFNRISPYLLLKKVDILPNERNSTFEMFFFDPNKATDAQFLRLGLSEKQIRIVRNYQLKGGSFRTKEGFFKLWGLRDDQKKRLDSLIQIESTEISFASATVTNAPLPIELNSADSVQLELLPGLGEKLSKRIVKYRDLLGGFYSLSQLKEVYGLSEQTIQLICTYLTLDATKIHKIDLNFSDVNELSKHPYIQKNLAKQIVRYRTKHGNIKDLKVLRDSMILNIDEFNRISPYY